MKISSELKEVILKKKREYTWSLKNQDEDSTPKMIRKIKVEKVKEELDYKIFLQ